jgi:nucleoside-diphosphate-sugar epimerase
MNILVTGGTGFLGSRVVPVLAERGHVVSAMSRSGVSAQRVEELGAKPLYGDLDDLASVDDAFAEAGAEALLNLASLGFGHGPAIVAAAGEANLRRAVFVSTAAVFTRLPAQSKAVRVAAEEAIRNSHLDWTIVRPTMIYGRPGDRNMARLLRLLRWSPVVPLPGGGRALQQPAHVDDVASFLVELLERPCNSRAEYDVAGPEPHSLRELIEQSAAAVARRPLFVPLPLGATSRLIRLYEGVTDHPRLNAEQVERLAEDKVFDIGPARRDLGFEPRSFSDGIVAEAGLL